MDTTKTYTITRNGKTIAKLRFLKTKQGWYLKIGADDCKVEGDVKAAWEAAKAAAPKTVRKAGKPKVADKPFFPVSMSAVPSRYATN